MSDVICMSVLFFASLSIGMGCWSHGCEVGQGCRVAVGWPWNLGRQSDGEGGVSFDTSIHLAQRFGRYR